MFDLIPFAGGPPRERKAIAAARRFRDEVLNAKLERGEDAALEAKLYRAAVRAILDGRPENAEPILSGKCVVASVALEVTGPQGGRLVSFRAFRGARAHG